MNNTDIEKAKDHHEAELFMIDGVEGIGIGQDAGGDEFIRVYVRDKAVAALVPSTLDGFPVRARVSGAFDAQPEA